MTFSRGDKVNVPFAGWVLNDFGDQENMVATYLIPRTHSVLGRMAAYVEYDGNQRIAWEDMLTPVVENASALNDDKDNSVDNIKVGDLVTVGENDASRYYTRAGNPSKYVRIDAGDRLTVTRVYTDTVVVNTSSRGSTHMSKAVLLPYRTPEQIEAERVARIEAAKGPDAIAVDDPRIAWIWAEAARLADEAGHCSEYDNLAEALGVPGRSREFPIQVEFPTVDDVVNDPYWLTVKAQNESEALDKARAFLALPSITLSISDD